MTREKPVKLIYGGTTKILALLFLIQSNY